MNILSIKTDFDANDINILSREFCISNENIFTLSLFSIEYKRPNISCDSNEIGIFTSINAVKSLIYHDVSIPKNSITVGKKSSNLILSQVVNAKISSYNSVGDLVYNLKKDKQYIYFRGENVKVDLFRENVKNCIVYKTNPINNGDYIRDIIEKKCISIIILYSQRSIDEFLKLNIGNNILYFIPYNCKMCALNVKYFDPNDPKFR
jgi:hypothetical protein